jgi:hypothetical protein
MQVERPSVKTYVQFELLRQKAKMLANFQERSSRKG